MGGVKKTTPKPTTPSRELRTDELGATTGSALNGYAALTLNGTALTGDVSQQEFCGVDVSGSGS